MVAAPDDRVSCRSPAGIHSARVGGSTQSAELVRTVSTPLAAQASWWSGWVCQSNTDPAGIGNVATITAASDGATHCAALSAAPPGGSARCLPGAPPGGSAVCPSSDTEWQATPLAAARLDRSVTRVNSNHDKLCGSPEWAAYLQDEVLPAATAGVDLGQEMLEIGPGPGAATGWLCQRVARLTALERDEPAAAALAARFPGVQVTVGDATRMSQRRCWCACRRSASPPSRSPSTMCCDSPRVRPARPSGAAHPDRLQTAMDPAVCVARSRTVFQTDAQ